MKKICKIIAVLSTVALLACSFTGCIVNTNPAVRVNETDLTRDDIMYIYRCLSQYRRQELM